MRDILIETTGWDGNPLYIAKNKILGIAPNLELDCTVLFMAVGQFTEEWRVREDAESLRLKYDNS